MRQEVPNHAGDGLGAPSGAESDGLHWPELDRPLGATADILWRTLWDDCGIRATIADCEARILRANAAMRAWLEALSMSQPEGKHARDILEPDQAEEIAGMVVRVSRTGEPLVLDTVIKGYATRMSMRRLPGEHPRGPLVLCTGLDMVAYKPGAVSTKTLSVQTRTRDLGLLDELTPKELEIAQHIAEGRTTNEIADLMGRKPKTIEWHRGSIRRKLGDRGEAMELAALVRLAGLHLRTGLIEPKRNGLMASPNDGSANGRLGSPTPAGLMPQGGGDGE